MLSRTELDNVRVILVATRNPLNIGAAARAMSNFGFQHLRVVNPYELAFREAKSAVGAAPLLRNAEEYTSLGDAVGDCSLVVGTTAARNRELRHALHPLTAGAALVSQAVTRERVGLLFGSEKRGLSNEDLSHCQWLMRIPTEEKHPSMNLGQAVAVCLYEIMRDRESPARPQVEKAATAKDLGRIEGSLMQALRISGYLDGKRSATREQDLRRFVRRLALEQADAELLIGMLRQILWKLEKK